MNIWPSWKEQKFFALVLSLLLLGIIAYLGAKIEGTIKSNKEIGKPVPFEHTINVEGEGRVNAKTDLATVTLTVDSKADTVPVAQEQNTTTMNNIIAQLNALGIAEDDIQTTSYNVYENWEWNPETETSEPKGWVVSQTVTVKIRDSAKVGDVLAMAGQNGVTNVSGPNFTVDDPSVYKDEAREEALADAKNRAELIANKLGVQLERVVGYSEWYEQPYPPQPYYGYALEAEGAAPDIQAGSQEVIMHVTITYTLVQY
jgi:hypothetical protein